MLALAAAAFALWAAGLACGPRPAASLAPALGEVVVAAPDGGGGTGDAGWRADGGCACATWGAPSTTGALADPQLVELSGLAASQAHPGVLWAHNDSGDTARFFAVSDTGAALGRFYLDGGAARDWEDVALGPCPTGTCLYLGDIGDNLTVRTDLAVYRVAEPDLEVATADGGTSGVAFERFAFEYPNGLRHNAETLLVHPFTGEVYVLTKHGAGVRSRVYRFPQPLDASTTATLEFLGELPVPGAGDLPLTAGDVSPCGNALLLRMYNRLVELRAAPGRPFEDVFSAAPVSVPVASEPQGEAVTWSPDGRGYYTASEGAAQPLSKVRCP